MRKRGGSYKVLGQGKGWKVKVLILKPKGKTSLQKHALRKEIWIRPLFYTTQIREVRSGQWHQLINPTDVEQIIIEIQLGVCLEKDIIRWKQEKK